MYTPSYFVLHISHSDVLWIPRGQGFNQCETKSCQYHYVSSFYHFIIVAIWIKYACYGIWHSSNVVSKIKGRVIKLAHRLLIERARTLQFSRAKAMVALDLN